MSYEQYAFLESAHGEPTTYVVRNILMIACTITEQL